MEKLIMEVFNEFEINTKFTRETSLDELGISSITILEMIVTFEEKYGFTFDDNDLLQENFQTIGTLMDLLEKYIKKRDN